MMRMNDSSGNKSRVYNNLKYYREKLGVTQKEMEWRTGISQNQWSKYEKGLRIPEVPLAQKFASVFNQISSEKGLELKKLTVDDLYPPSID